jgi:alpha-beta hydrolase superfamily lysophospholipase
MTRSFHSRDGTRLFARLFDPTGTSRATVVTVHGMGEQSSRYLHVGEALAAAGFRVATFDLRGHGRSGGKRGVLPRYALFLDDVAAAVAEFRMDAQPLFLYAHSLGGQIAINFILRDRPPLAGAVIASPWLRLAFQPSPLKLLLAGVMRRIWPSFTQEADHDMTNLSRDPDFLKSMPDHDLNHRRVSAQMYFELTKGARRALAGAPDFRVPLFLLHGTADRVTSFSASEEFFGRVPIADKLFKAYPGGVHETHNDLCRDEVLADVVGWLQSHCPRNVAP